MMTSPMENDDGDIGAKTSTTVDAGVAVPQMSVSSMEKDDDDVLVVPNKSPPVDAGVAYWRASTHDLIVGAFADCVTDLVFIMLDYLAPTQVQLPPFRLSEHERLVYIDGGNAHPAAFCVAHLQSLPECGYLKRNELLLVAQPYHRDWPSLTYMRESVVFPWGVDRCQLSVDETQRISTCHGRSKGMEMQKQFSRDLRRITTVDSNKPVTYQTRIIVHSRHAQECDDDCCVGTSHAPSYSYPPAHVSVPLPVPNPITRAWLTNPTWSISQF